VNGTELDAEEGSAQIHAALREERVDARNRAVQQQSPQAATMASANDDRDNEVEVHRICEDDDVRSPFGPSSAALLSARRHAHTLRMERPVWPGREQT